MSSDTTPTAVRPNRLVWWFVAGLPLGLVVMGALSFIFYFQKRNQRMTPQPSRLAAMLRKDLSMEDFARYERILSQDLGERSLNKPENLDAAASFIESTLGLNNMGYAAVRRGFTLQGRELVNIEAELRGSQRPRDLVLVAARYDGSDVRGLAAMLCLANALTATTHSSTVRFVALVVGDANDEEKNGAAAYRDWISRTEFDKVTVLLDETSPESAVIKSTLKDIATSIKPLPLSSKISLAELQQAEALIRSLADGKVR